MVGTEAAPSQYAAPVTNRVIDHRRDNAGQDRSCTEIVNSCRD